MQDNHTYMRLFADIFFQFFSQKDKYSSTLEACAPFHIHTTHVLTLLDFERLALIMIFCFIFNWVKPSTYTNVNIANTAAKFDLCLVVQDRALVYLYSFSMPFLIVV